MRQMQNNFRRSIAINQALETAKQPSSKIVKTKRSITTETPIEPIIETKSEPIVEKIKPTIEEPKIIEQPKVEEQPQHPLKSSRLPNLGK